MDSGLRKLEIAIATGLTIAAASFHVLAARYAGALWRDEANTVGLATLPTLGDVWANLQFDSFPLLWVLLVRQLAAVFGPMNDQAFRIAGFAIGLLVILAVWASARSFGHRLPLVALALFAMNPSVVRWGDAFRAYGLGMALAIVSIGCVWRFAASGGRANLLVAVLVVLLSVQTTFYNAIVVLSVCVGGFSACAVLRQWQRGFAVITIGVAAALSLVPYASTIRSASSWNSLVQTPIYDVSWFLIKLSQTLNAAGDWAFTLWLAALLLALAAVVREWLAGNRLELSVIELQLVIFGSVTLVVGAVANYLFLQKLSYYTQPWYYLTLLATTAICIDAISGVLIRARIARIARLIAVSAIGLMTLVNVDRSLRYRMTSVDSIASILATEGTDRDLIVLSPWYSGITFARYFDGSSTWTMLPDLGFHRFHRYDLLSSAMQRADQSTPAEPILRSAANALRSGGSVYVVGDQWVVKDSGRRPLPAAIIPDDGWKSFVYQDQWHAMLTSYLTEHAEVVADVDVPSPVPVSRYENPSVKVARGWRR